MDVTAATQAASSTGVGASQSAKSASAELGQDAFLKLMLTQLKAQDPLSPMESGEFLSQLAQFSSVTALEELNGAFARLSSSLTAGQAMEASQLVGRTVVVPGASLELGSDAEVTTSIELPAMVPDLNVNLYDVSGQLVRSMSMAGQGPGLVDVHWDGSDDSGEALPAGLYRVEASGTLNGEARAFETFVPRRVNGVALEPETDVPLLLVGAGDPIRLEQVREIR